MSLVSTQTTSVKYQPYWDRSNQRNHYDVLSAHQLRNTLSPDLARRTRRAVQIHIDNLPAAQRDSQQRQMPSQSEWAKLVGFYAEALRNNIPIVELSRAEISSLSGVNRSYVAFMHRMLRHIGWIFVAHRWGVGKLHGNEQVLNKSALRCLTPAACKALNITRFIKDVALHAQAYLQVQGARVIERGLRLWEKDFTRPADSLPQRLSRGQRRNAQTKGVSLLQKVSDLATAALAAARSSPRPSAPAVKTIVFSGAPQGCPCASEHASLTTAMLALERDGDSAQLRAISPGAWRRLIRHHPEVREVASQYADLSERPPPPLSPSEIPY